MATMIELDYLILVPLNFLFVFYLNIGLLALIGLNFFLLNVIYFWTMRKTLIRDARGLYTMLSIQFRLHWRWFRNHTVASVFDEQVQRYDDRKLAFINIETGSRWTFRDADSFSNRVANYFRNEGFRKGDVVALYMNNCPEYALFWLGLSKLGVVSALINYNLKNELLGHSLHVGDAKAIIVGGDLQESIVEAMQAGHIRVDFPTYVFNSVNEECKLLVSHGKNLGSELENETVSILPPKLSKKEQPSFRDILMYIYTSGTTGLPKAAIISNARFMLLSYGPGCAFQIKPEDRMYITMPMYHAAASIIGIGQCIVGGSTAVIKKKFSASRFWDDCAEYDCTVSQYIGELCRYLLAQPSKESDRQHKIRLMFGNGLRAELWDQFVKRFGVKQIGEFYGSTEGNTSLVNIDNHPGACGFLPPSYLTKYFHPVALIKIDPSTGELVRDSRGLCVPCGRGESGEILGKIKKGQPFHEFAGYVSGNETKKKVVRDVFQHGDMAFSSGDVLYMDELGYLYFKDRLGDTFRWKGENVSTTEVEGVIQRATGMNDATVYGVEIPGLEGKAGMAAIVDESGSINLAELKANLKEKLPPYARPVFIRLCDTVQTTGTFKLVKHDLQRAGYDPEKCEGDKLYYMNSKTGEYEKITQDIYNAIQKAKITF